MPADTPFQATAATPLYVKNSTFLPVNVPDEPNANFGVGVPLTGKGKATPASRPSPAKPAGAAAAPGATPNASPAGAEAPKKPPAGVKVKAPALGVKKPVFKKM